MQAIYARPVDHRLVQATADSISGRRELIGAVLAGCVLLAGCGGDDSPSSTRASPSVEQPDPTNPTTDPAILPQDPAASTGDPALVAPPLDSVGSTQARNLAPAVAAADLQARVDGNNAFAGDFYRAVAALPGVAGANVVYSPYSLVSALAMTYAGAAGATATQMAAALNINKPASTFHASFNQLDLELTSRDSNAADAALQVSNGLFLQRDYPVKTDFVDALGVNYGAPVYLVDNLTLAAAEITRAQINAWVSERTNNKIVNLLPGGSTYEAKVILANTVLFKGNWQMPFDTGMTRPMAFSLTSGATVDVPMMRQDASVRVASGSGFTALSLPYVGEAYEMVLVLPDPGRLASVESQSALSRPAELLAGATLRHVWLNLPRFKFKTNLSANGLLTTLGMSDAFDGNLADFSAITGGRDLFIHQVAHSAAVAVDEKGTEAAAATAVVIGPVVHVPREDLTFDRPFLFLIVDMATQSVIFMGRVMDPSQS